MPVQALLLLTAAALIANTWRRQRRGDIPRIGAVVWSCLWGSVGVVALWPNLASRLASAIGVGRGADLIVYFALIVLFWMVFRVFLKQRQLESDLTRLVQALAMRDLPAAEADVAADSTKDR
jgi:hypothetical protein